MSKNQSVADSSANSHTDHIPLVEKLWSFDELSRRYGVHVATVRRWSRDGRLTAIQIGRMKRVRDRDRALFEGEPVRAAQ